MTLIKIKGHEFTALPVRDSFNRRAQKFKNNIVVHLRTIGVHPDDVHIDLEPLAMKRSPASASWYFEGSNLHFSYKACLKYVDNLFVVSKIIEFEVKDILEGKKSFDEFITDFTEEGDVEEERRAARELIGVDPDCLDLNKISKAYKLLAKNAHPDMPTGDTERFKELNRAHKILKRELE